MSIFVKLHELRICTLYHLIHLISALIVLFSFFNPIMCFRYFFKMVNPIETITPYNPKISIKARVISKSEIRVWDKPTGSGSLFSIDMQDQSGKIRLTAFKKKVDEYFNKVEVGKVYVIR